MTAATAASKAKAADAKADTAAGKRKREALVEVTSLVTNNKGKGKAVSGKEKDAGHPTKEKFDGVVIKTIKATTTTTTLRSSAKPISSSKRPAPKVVVEVPVLEDVVEVPDEHAMAIDEHHTTNRRVSARNAGVASRRAVAEVEEDEEEASRVTKKARPSSEAPPSPAQIFQEQLHQVSDANSADFHAINEEDPEAEADPEGEDWTDLDAEDADDPLMVSEYVVEIFQYMKEIEVRHDSSRLVSRRSRLQ